MQLSIRLYYPADSDLIAVRLRMGRRFVGFVRECLDSCANGEDKTYPIPEDIRKYIRPVSRPVTLNLNLKEGRDDTSIAFLQRIKPSCRSDVVKTLVRSCYDHFPVFVYDDGMPVPEREPIHKSAGSFKKTLKKDPAPIGSARDSKEQKKPDTDGHTDGMEDIPVKTPLQDEKNAPAESSPAVHKTPSESHTENTDGLPGQDTGNGYPLPEGNVSEEAYDIFNRLLGGF